MQTLETLEVRWFLDEHGPQLASLRAWFEGAKSEPERRDDYVLTGRSDLGLKARASGGELAKFEVKYLRHTLGSMQLVPRITGNVENWSKLSLDTPDEKADASWLRVHKVRTMRSYRYQSGKAVEANDGESHCNVELTRLRWNNGTTEGEAWTLGFEASGAERKLLDVLTASVHTAVSAGLHLEADAFHSLNYPQWLLRVAPH